MRKAIWHSCSRIPLEQRLRLRCFAPRGRGAIRLRTRKHGERVSSHYIESFALQWDLAPFGIDFHAGHALRPDGGKHCRLEAALPLQPSKVTLQRFGEPPFCFSA